MFAQSPQWMPASPDAKTMKQAYRHNPYGKPAYMMMAPEPAPIHYAAPAPAPAVAVPALDAAPEGTRHMGLWGAVSFVPYPTEEFHAPQPDFTHEEPVRVFVGQLPYFVTDMQLSWLCYTFGGFTVAFPERIMKRQPNGERLPTGCIHGYATPSAVEAMADGMHKRMLVDDTGVWYAQTAEEFDVLTDYVRAMKNDRRLRVPNRPYDSVVVQVATSTYVPDAPMPLTQMPAERKQRVSPQNGRAF